MSERRGTNPKDGSTEGGFLQGPSLHCHSKCGRSCSGIAKANRSCSGIAKADRSCSGIAKADKYRPPGEPGILRGITKARALAFVARSTSKGTVPERLRLLVLDWSSSGSVLHWRTSGSPTCARLVFRSCRSRVSVQEVIQLTHQIQARGWIRVQVKGGRSSFCSASII